MKKALFLLLLLPVIAFSQSTLVTWNTNSNSVAPTVSSGQYLNALSITAAGVTGPTANYNGAETSGWPTTATYATDKYIYYTIASLPNNSVTVTKVSFSYRGVASLHKAEFLVNGVSTGTVYEFNDTNAAEWTDRSFTITPSSPIVIDGGKTLTLRLSAANGSGFVVRPLTITGTSTTPSAYAGTYHVGAAQSYPLNTITNAANALTSYGVSAPVTLLLDDALYSTNETFPIVFGKIGGSTTANNTSATKTITIKPATGVSPSIQANNGYANNNTVYVPAVFILKGADYVTFDGSNTTSGSTQNLTIINKNTESASGRRAVIWVADNAGDAATYITVKNTILKQGSANSGSTLNAGIYSGKYNLGGTNSAHIEVATAAANNSNLTVTNNTFTNIKQAVVVNGGTGSALATNVVVTNNDMGGYDSSNTVRLFSGVYLNNVSTFEVTANSIHDILREDTGSDSTTDTYTQASGIYVTGASKEGSITKNQIKNVVRTADNSYLFAGIYLESSEASANVVVANNFVTGVRTKGGGDSAQDAQGIAIFKGGNYKIYFNTVSMTGSQSNGGYSSAFYVGSAAGTGLDVRNNIFANYQTNSATRRTAVMIFKSQSAVTTTFTYLNYNNLYAPFAGYLGTSPNTGDYVGFQPTLQNLQGVLSGFEANATNVSPSFISTTDLHLTADNAVNATLAGTVIGSVTRDIDGQLRSFTTPTIGADEYGVSTYTNSTTCDNSTTWDGTAWSNGTPNATTNAIFKGSYTQNGGTLNACTLFVLDGATVNFTNSSTAKVTHSVNVALAGSLTFESSSVLIQTGDDANTGTATIKRNSSKLKRLDYTIWSAPVVDARTTGFQTLRQFSPMTSNGRFYTYKTSDGLFYPVDESNTKFALGSGYLIRMPNSDATTGYNAGTTRIIYNGVFTGTPNNGTIVKNLDYTDTVHGFNIVGNPYPSPISVKDFINANINSIDGTVWLWRKNNNQTQTSYCTVNLSGYVANAAPGGTSADGNDLVLDPYAIDPNGSLNTAQGFFVKSKAAGSQIVFRNTMRLDNHSQTFFKSAAAQATEEDSAVSRVWLNVTNAAGEFDQTLVAYNSLTTLGYDNGYDGKTIAAGSINLYSVANTENDTLNLAIQARGTFNAADIVPMGFKATDAGTYTISIDHSDGVFAAGQIVYLTDNVEGITRNLSLNSYTFTTEAGDFTNRFVVTYAPQGALGTEPVAVPVTDVIVYNNDHQIGITAPQSIKSVVVYDMLGKSLYNNAKVNSNEFKTSEIKSAQQVVVVLVTLENNQVVTKKIMMN